MHIICPHCTTSYAIDLATLGVAGRTVRCSRCKEVWLARPEDAAEVKTPAAAMAEAGQPAANADPAAEWDALAREHDGEALQIPVVDSPSISADWPADGGGSSRLTGPDWSSVGRHELENAGPARQPPSGVRRPAPPPTPFSNPPTRFPPPAAL